MNGADAAWDRAAWARVIGLALALVPMLVRLQTPLEMNPWWDGDPSSREAVVIGMRPSVSVAGDLVSLAGAAVLIGASGRRRAWMTSAVLLAALGGWACLWWSPRVGFEARAAVAAGAWVSATAVSLGVWFAAGDRRIRVLAFAVIVGAVGLLAVKGAYQCFVEHPATVATFQRDKARILAEQGWSPDSSMAKTYERRLLQSEATGWFGFANVFATFAAMGTVAFGVAAVGAARSRRERAEMGEAERGPWPAAICGAGAAVCAVALVLAGAKGGFAACAVGVAAAAGLGWLRSERGARFRRWAWMVGALAVVLPLCAVAARGVVGERIGELSLLFRWFYMQGAARIFGAHLAHGVGPDGFQAAYSLAKNPLSPEDVTSPHSVMWDWAACLGVAGLAWAVWLVWAGARVGPVAVAASTDRAGVGRPGEMRVLMRAACLMAAASAMLSIPMQYAALLPEEAFGVRIGGLVVWCVLSCGLLAAAGAWDGWVVALAAGAVVVLAHTQIEITGVLPQSCGLALAVVGLAASPRGASGEREAEALRTGASLAARLTGVLACLAGAFVLIGTAGATLGGELRMKRAYGTLGPVRQLRQSLEAAVRDRSPDAPELAARLRGVEPDTLRAAAETLPTSWPAARSASQLAMQLAQAYAADARSTLALAWGARAVEYALSMPDEALGALLVNRGVTEQEAADAFARVRSVSAAFAAGGRLDSQRAGWAATLCLAAADKVQAPSSREWLEAAVEFLTAAESLDPYNPFHVQRRMDALTALGRRDDARSAARRLLEVDELQRLDRAVRGLSDRDRAKARRIAEAGRG